MRSRPTVRVRITPSVLEPGATFVAAVELDFKSETPVEHVRISFGYWETSFQSWRGPLQEREHVWKPGKLATGKHVREVRFQVPLMGAPSFRGSGTSVSYLVSVHVDIPWWVNRDATFSIPVVVAPETPPDAPQPLVATSDGPRANELYVELSADRDHIAPGETLSGSVSLANVASRRVRGVEAGFIRRERDLSRGFHVDTRWTAPIHRGEAPEQESIPFRISLPADAVPSFRTPTFAVEWRFEVRALVSYGEDVVLGFPIKVLRRRPDEPLQSRKPYLVGRDRWTAVWEAIAQRTGMIFSKETQSLTAAAGSAVSLELRREVAGAHVAVIGRIRYPHLGLGLNLHERSLSDLLASRKVPLRNPVVETRFVATAREPAQAERVLDDNLLQSLLPFSDVRMNDDELVFAVARAATTAQSLTPVVGAAQRTLEWIAKAVARVPPPSAMAASAPAWEAFARSVGGRLEYGRMWIHDGEIGGERFAVGCVWHDSSLDTSVTVHAAPPFEDGFVVDDPSLSPATRECLKTLAKLPGFVGARDGVSWVLPGGIPDPETLREHLEIAAKLIRGRRGLTAAGPFR